MKKLSTIQREEKRIRKFIHENINSYLKNSEMEKQINEALIADAMLIWVQGSCKWTPSSYLRIFERNKNDRKK